MKKTLLRIISLMLVAIMLLFAVGCDIVFDIEDTSDITWPQINDTEKTTEPKFEEEDKDKDKDEDKD